MFLAGDFKCQNELLEIVAQHRPQYRILVVTKDDSSGEIESCFANFNHTRAFLTFNLNSQKLQAVNTFKRERTVAQTEWPFSEESGRVFEKLLS